MRCSEYSFELWVSEWVQIASPATTTLAEVLVTATLAMRWRQSGCARHNSAASCTNAHITFVVDDVVLLGRCMFACCVFLLLLLLIFIMLWWLWCTYYSNKNVIVRIISFLSVYVCIYIFSSFFSVPVDCTQPGPEVEIDQSQSK